MGRAGAYVLVYGFFIVLAGAVIAARLKPDAFRWDFDLRPQAAEP